MVKDLWHKHFHVSIHCNYSNVYFQTITCLVILSRLILSGEIFFLGVLKIRFWIFIWCLHLNKPSLILCDKKNYSNIHIIITTCIFFNCSYSGCAGSSLRCLFTCLSHQQSQRENTPNLSELIPYIRECEQLRKVRWYSQGEVFSIFTKAVPFL